MSALLTYRGTVYPWHCDHVGHMNVMWYVGKFDEATWQLFNAIGLTPSYLRSSQRGMAAVDQHIAYLRELHAGAVVSISTEVKEMHEKRIVFTHEMRNDESGEVAARTTLVGVHIDTSARKSCPFPAFAADAAKALIPAPEAVVALRRARIEDAPAVATCVCEAYAHYIERIGKQPGPMLEDYAEVIQQSQVHVAVAGSRVVGAVVLKLTPEGFYLDNVSVRPAVKGQGVGRRLLELAESEARRLGYDSIYLATHELMTENRALYSRIGYVEYDSRIVNGYPRVFFRKVLA
jgi:acyl-CoA thioester hydrolase